MSLSILGRNQRLDHLLPEARELRITGFQSPAEDEKEGGLSLDALTGLGAPQILGGQVDDNSLIGFGMYPGDRLIVDRGTMRKREQYYVVVDLASDGCYRVRMMADNDRSRSARWRPKMTSALSRTSVATTCWRRCAFHCS
ncbi:S24 family peptidase [Pseudomonas sp. GD03944]|uniref:S24 family peptidase n=1 Tax=Pseudomonas sp. GD03944 TaxID=2975409 RepID=UPI00244CC173|nr:S24 family peptidase [Pseudomonas sp. GD03944]MDH1263554.1 S24 family peptidase [Pseudomonas sp. GD03944]